ncbi:Beta-1,4-endoglucanase [Meloidogyne graminicola]|uniref:Beta-1,4-endoglucanase n=1 Tax=Meloidogyne graminicola TaxID=189291 RepID=A0A8T0A1C7_9BILA|nr:Beta-1,4-endoglucanase [Meloidogyne graminicola]
MSLFHSQIPEGSIFYNEETIQALKCSWNVNIIRACLGVMNYGQSGYLVDKNKETKKVKDVIDAAIKLGIYVLVDFHYTGNQLYTNESKQFFQEISAEYKGIPNLLFEIMNEAVNIPWKTLKQYHETIIPVIRENSPDAIIICSTPEYDQNLLEAYNDPITNFNNNIMYTLHFYTSEPGSELLRSSVENILQKKFPLFVTEYGLSLGTGGGGCNKYEMNIWWQMLDKYKVSYINWSISNKSESSAALIPGSTSADVGNDSHLTESGSYVKQMLKNKQPAPIGC